MGKRIEETSPQVSESSADEATSEDDTPEYNPGHQLLSAMSVEERNQSFGQLLNTSGEPCPRVSVSQLQGVSDEKEAFWSVACTDGGRWMISILPDEAGTARILHCGMLKLVAGSECFKPW